MLKITDSLLKDTVEHIKYEIGMFRLSGQYLINEKDRILHNALVEIFAIHTRNLFIFFYTEMNKRVQDDVLAEDYILDEKAFIRNRTPKEQLEFIIEKANKQVSHLTYSRNKYNEQTKGWPIYDITCKVEKTINAFMNALPEEKELWFR